MRENRLAAYYQLIEKLLECPSGEEPQILNAHFELLDPGFLQTIIVFAKLFDDDGDQEAAEFLTDLALQVGEFLGSEQHPTVIRKSTADILFEWGIKQFYNQVLVALQCWQQCLTIYQAIHDRLGEASSLGNLGNAYDSLGEYERAIAFHEQSLAIKREIKDRRGEANSLGNLANAYDSLGEYERAIAFHEQHLAISREIKNRQGEATSLGNLGNAYDSLGEYERAIAFHEQSLAIKREIKDRRGEANSLGNLANVYNSQGKYERAINYYEQSLAIKREIKDRQGEASSLGNLGTVYRCLGQFERAINYYEQHLAISRKIKYRVGEANSLGNLGNAYFSLGQFERAIAFHEQHLIISREIKDRQGEASCLGNLGTVYRSLGQFERAIDYHEQHLAISRKIKYRLGEASSLGNLGNAYFSLGQFERAIAFHEQSLAICREIKYRVGEANILGSLGNAYQSLGNFERAIAFHEQHLAISREIKDRKGEGNSLGSLGTVYRSLGQFEHAINYLEQHLTISREIKDRKGEGNSLGGLGNAYCSLGQFERAINYLEQSLAISREIKARNGEGRYLGSLGNAYCSLGQFEQAINYLEQSLTISREIKDRQGEGNFLGSLGVAYDSLGQFERGINYLEQSLAISREIKDRQAEGNSLGNLGVAYNSLGQYERAINYYEQYLAISREIKDWLGEGNSLNNIGNAYHKLQQTQKAIENYRDCLKIANPITMSGLCFTASGNLGDIGFTKGDWQLALEGYELAMQAVEQLRQGSTTDKRRQKIIKDAISVYANAVQCYINLKQYDKAVETADRSRSRHLADLFASKDLYTKGEIPLELKEEVEEYYHLQQQINGLRFSENEGTKALTATTQQNRDGNVIIQQITNLETTKQKVWLKIASKDQVLAGQLQPDPLSFDKMQALILNAETAILNFYTTEEHTHIFILRQNQPPQLHTCEGQGIETLHIWIFDNWLKPYKENRTQWQNQLGEFLPDLANRLQIDRLIDQHLNGIKELIIIPHLYLHQIPFAALPLNNIPIPHSDTAADQTRGPSLDMDEPTDTSAETPTQQPEYLSDKFRLRIVPSCQILNFCHQRGNFKPATMGIVENATGDLVFTGYECETLAKMHEVTQDSRLQYQQATINNYQNLLDRVQVLHSSHHASSQLDNSLESKLHLFDGAINLGRIFTWRFSHLAEVFLSCCETNLTFTEITDDPLSIASGFLCAGAKNVVSTLWAVDDLATALFCILYYQEKQVNSRSEALRKAQFKLRNLTGDELYTKYKRQLDAYFEQQQWGEKQAEFVKLQRLRLDLLCREELPFVSPRYWAGFVSQGLA